ncbi:uncharacterized protein I206_105267 [Kwoniella pini CBS 10737]|uniref:Uncharacterized protein n=1 Tax=Kwoniella pini CBS 10737 TaxID=1296096 RepID=A0A1B9I4R2_9TREE|nr:uncharacterized protein I206_03824 [Kwoniella pini CBS 10737]OCF50500.1 hypothetical protein I206_03824 [Kwoniella pini CBS 10737]
MKETNVRFLPPHKTNSNISLYDHPTIENRTKQPISPPPNGFKKRPLNSYLLSKKSLKIMNNNDNNKNNNGKINDDGKYWNDYYSTPYPINNFNKLPKPHNGTKLYSTKWKNENENKNKNKKQFKNDQAFYGNPMMSYGMMYPSMMGGMGGMGGMGMNPMSMGYGMGGGMGGGMGMMGYGMPRYGGGYGYGGYGGYPGMVDPMMGQYGAPPAANFVDDFEDAHRIEHAYRQSAPDAYGMGMGMMGGGMGINTMPGSQLLMYGRGMPYNGWYA